jgi:hypothetical protein
MRSRRNEASDEYPTGRRRRQRGDGLPGGETPCVCRKPTSACQFPACAARANGELSRAAVPGDIIFARVQYEIVIPRRPECQP